jgi:hypothetical protein
VSQGRKREISVRGVSTRERGCENEGESKQSGWGNGVTVSSQRERGFGGVINGRERVGSGGRERVIDG